mmetsp:Transcript_15068/g.32739  ORF Transcript_15068/g.32739 Transcript_15068/m.32739 type:complete len:331 (+) Transcript_15068:1361-2353(+)
MPLRPTISTAVEGPAASMSPRASESLRTRPHCAPATMTSPTRKVPFCTSAVATAPKPTTCRASTTVPAARRSGLDLRSRRSACSCSCSRRPSRLVRSLADTSAERTSPPNSSRTISCSSSCVFTLLGSLLGLSILLIATTTGTLAALAALMEEMVCSLTPSSAATTRTTMSVTFAPRDRISEKAAWPGVSMKVIVCPFGAVTADAPICCVMPPASPATVSVERSASNSDVLPWSTWPMTVTTGGRETRFSSSSPSTTPQSSSAALAASPWSPRVTSAPKPSAMASAVSASIDCVIEARTPFFIRSFTTSATPTLRASASSPTVMVSPRRT